MNTIDNNSTKTINTAPYQSVAALKEAHVSLIKRHRGESGADAGNFYDDVEEFLRRASATGALLDDYDDREASQSLLDYWATVLMRVKRVPPEATLDDFDETLSPVLDDRLCPYLGLNAFQEKDKDFFYGRQRMIDHLIGEMKERRFLFVVGPSGSGKSSLVLGGAIPALQNGVLTGSERWQYFPRVLPGANPLKSLAAALGFQKQSEHEETEAFKQDRERLRLLVEERGGGEPVVLVIDQFEEIFTLCADETVREAFVENLIALVNSPNRRHTVVVTLRNDYEPNLVRIQSLLPYYEAGQIRVTPLTATDLREAIEEPAKRVGLKFESGIVDALVKDILGEPAGLPLLQFTLLQLWKRRENKRSRITWRNYRGLGDARRALSLTAEEFYNSLTDEKKVTVKRILLRMARPSESFEVTSNRIKRSTLYKSEGVPQRVDEVIDSLLGAGLVRLTTGDRKENDQIEVAHEALVRNWRRLVEWLEDDRVNLRQRIRLTSAADQWVEHNRDAGGLLGGKVLEEALEFDDLNELETEFVEASQAAAETAEQEKAAAAFREQTLEKARVVAFEQRAIEVARNASYFRRFAFASTVLAIFALCAAGWALYNASRARASELEAQRNLVKAQEESDRAEKESQTAIEQYNRAEKESQTAIEQYNRAEEKRREAEEARTELSSAIEEVKKEREQADELRRKAEQNAGELQSALQKAQEETRRADEAAILASYESQRAKMALEERDDATEKLRRANEQKLKLMEKQREADRKLETGRGGDAIGLYVELLEEYKVAKSPANERETLSKLVKAYRVGSLQAQKEANLMLKEKYSGDSKNAYQTAEAMFSEDINGIRKKIEESGQPDPAIVPALEERAEFYLYQNDPKKAGEDFFAAFEAQEKMLSKANYESFAEFDYLVGRLKELPDYKYNVAKLAPIFERDLAAKEKFFDANSINVYFALDQLGDLYKYSSPDNERQDAAKIYAKALAIARKQEGPYAAIDVIDSLKNLGDVYFTRSQYESARSFYEELLKVVENGWTESFESAEAKIKLAEIYKRSNIEKTDEFYKKLEKLYSSAIDFLAEESDKYREESLKYRMTLIDGLDGQAQLYLDQNKVESAQKTFDKLIKIIGADFISLATIKGRFRVRAAESVNDKRFDKAELYYRLILQLAENSGENNVDVYYAAYDLADFYQSQQIKTAEAETLYKRVLAVARAVFKDDETGDVNIRTRNGLAKIYNGQKKIAEAETLYKNNLAVLEKSPAQQTDTRLLVETLRAYADFLWQFGNRQAEVDALLARIRDLSAKGK